jgi:hypothetical protein
MSTARIGNIHPAISREKSMAGLLSNRAEAKENRQVHDDGNYYRGFLMKEKVLET